MKRTLGWFVRKGNVRGKGDWLFWAQWYPNTCELVWDRSIRLLFKRKNEAARFIEHLGPGGARLVRYVRKR